MPIRGNIVNSGRVALPNYGKWDEKDYTSVTYYLEKRLKTLESEFALEPDIETLRELEEVRVLLGRM